MLVIDMQNDFCDPNSIRYGERKIRHLGAPRSGPPGWNVSVDAARLFSVPVIWVRTTHDDTTNSPVWLARHSLTLRADNPPEDNCKPGTWGADFSGRRSRKTVNRR